MKEAIVFFADGRDPERTWFQGDPPLKWLQDAVGGLIERVPLADLWSESVMWAHEEALLTPSPALNSSASMLAQRLIFGDVVLVLEVVA